MVITRNPILIRQLLYQYQKYESYQKKIEEQRIPGLHLHTYVLSTQAGVLQISPLTGIIIMILVIDTHSQALIRKGYSFY